MSARYEHTDAASTPVALVGPGTELGDDIVADHTLVIGDKCATALVVEGSPAELAAFIDRLGSLVTSKDG